MFYGLSGREFPQLYVARCLLDIVSWVMRAKAKGKDGLPWTSAVSLVASRSGFSMSWSPGQLPELQSVEFA